MFAPRREEARGGCIKLINKLYYLSSSPNILVIKSLRMRWVGQVACMDKKPNAYSELVVTPEEKDHPENPGTNWITLTKILKNRMWGCGMDSSGSNMTNDGLAWTQFHTNKCKGKDFHAHTMKTYKRSWGAPHILTSALVKGRQSTSRPHFFTPGEEIWYPLNRRLDKSQSQSGHSGAQKNLLPLPGLEPQIIQTVAESLYWLH